MKHIGAFIRRERLYILLLVFIVLINVAIMVPHKRPGGKAVADKTGIASSVDKPGSVYDDLIVGKEEADRILSENKVLTAIFGLTSLLMLLLLSLGIIVDAILISIISSRGRVDIATCSVGPVRWSLWDIIKVVMLFLFFGYMLVMSESFLARLFPIVNDDNFRMMFNSSILDIITVVLILYFVVIQHRERLSSLGLSVKNFARNVFYGLVGYVAAIPMFAVVLVIIAVFISVFKYVPEKQPVVELFLKEKNTAFLAYTSLFAAIVGPFIEELFFRGFMYGALKKYIGVFWAMMVTAAIFSGLHSNLAGFLPIMMLGMLLAYLYEKTGTLVSSITVHIIHNFGMILFVFLIKQLKA